MKPPATIVPQGINLPTTLSTSTKLEMDLSRRMNTFAHFDRFSRISSTRIIASNILSSTDKRSKCAAARSVINRINARHSPKLAQPHLNQPDPSRPMTAHSRAISHVNFSPAPGDPSNLLPCNHVRQRIPTQSDAQPAPSAFNRFHRIRSAPPTTSITSYPTPVISERSDFFDSVSHCSSLFHGGLKRALPFRLFAAASNLSSTAKNLFRLAYHPVEFAHDTSWEVRVKCRFGLRNPAANTGR
jgi:hypothetical protein